MLVFGFLGDIEIRGAICRNDGQTNLKSRLYQLNEWQAIDAIYSVSEFAFKLWNWKSTRLFVVVREEVQGNKGPWAAS
jgi:hypothetical protein